MNEEAKVNTAEATQQTEEAAAQAAAAAEAAQESASASERGGGAAAAEGGGSGETATEQKPRDLFYERIRTNFPEGKYDEDEEEYFRNANSYNEELEKDRAALRSINAKFEKLLGGDPQKAEVILDIMDGIDPRVSYARHYGPEFLSVPEEGTDAYEDFVKAGEERRKELNDMKAKVDEYRANAEASAAALDEFAAENNLSDEQKAEFSKFISEELLPAIYAGKMDKSLYNLLQHGRNYDADIEGAREQGRIDGRNEKIEVEKKHLAGSTLPNGGAGGNASKEVEAPKGNKTADWLAGMSKRRV